MSVENIINDLVGYKNLKIIQCNDYFNFSLDSILLPNFVEIKKEYKKILDLGCGNAPIPLILSTKTTAKIIGIELQDEIYKLACDTVKLNKLEDRIEIRKLDIKDLLNFYKAEYFDLIFSNPPYFKNTKESILNENTVKTNARHETLIDLEKIIEISASLLKNKGVFALIHRSERLSEILSTLTKYKLEPKRIRFVFPKAGKESNLVLIEARKNTNPGVKILSPLIVHTKTGAYTKEILKMFEN